MTTTPSPCPQFALIYFTRDRVFDIVNTSHIRNFHPKTVSDFKKDKVYNVGWTACKRLRLQTKTVDAPTPTSFPAVIVQLSDDEDELQNVLDSGSRIRIPNITTFSTEPMTDDANTDGDAVVQRQRHLLAMAKKNKMEKAASSSKRLKEILKQNNKVTLSDSSDENESGTTMATVTKSKRGLKRNGSSEEQHDCTRCLELGEIKLENRKLRKLNIKLQQRLVHKLEEKDQNDYQQALLSQQSTAAAPTPVASSSAIAPTPNGHVTLANKNPSSAASTIAIQEKHGLQPQDLVILDRKRKPSLFAKNLLVKFCGSDTLRHSSLDGKMPNRGTNSARTPIDPNTVGAIKTLVCQRYGQSEVLKVNRYIIEKIADLRKSIIKKTES